MRRYLLILILLLVVTTFTGCTAADAWTEDVYYEGSVYINERQILPPYYIEIYNTTSGTVAITAADTPVAVAVPTTNEYKYKFITNSNCCIQYEGSETRLFSVNVFISLSSDTPNVLSTTYVFVNNQPHDESGIQRYIASAGDVGALAIGHILELRRGDLVQVYMAGDKAANITVEHISFQVVAL